MRSQRLILILIQSFFVTMIVFVLVVLLFALHSKKDIFFQVEQQASSSGKTIPFPVSVNIYTEEIIESPYVAEFYANTLANAPFSDSRWWNKVASVLAPNKLYQSLASPVSRIIVIWPGERKEQVVQHIGDIMRWNNTERAEFTELIDSSLPILGEGKYFPGQYITHRAATPNDIFVLISSQFQTEVLNRYTTEVSTAVPLQDALIIASLLEREASDFENMREVSGVIWNRLFIDMPLQLDATLQYVRGSSPNEQKWWPLVKPADKFVDSPFNTYQNKNLPPAPISNPSSEAILAALNPIITDCIYYFHTDDGKYVCSTTYEEHVSKLQTLYGTGS
jgi:uncharacterized YceG family protein